MHRIFSVGLYITLDSVIVLRRLRNCRDIIIIIIIIIIVFFKPSKNQGRKKIEKVKKNGEANVPSGRPTQNYCATKQNYYYYYYYPRLPRLFPSSLRRQVHICWEGKTTARSGPFINIYGGSFYERTTKPLPTGLFTSRVERCVMLRSRTRMSNNVIVIRQFLCVTNAAISVLNFHV